MVKVHYGSFYIFVIYCPLAKSALLVMGLPKDLMLVENPWIPPGVENGLTAGAVFGAVCPFCRGLATGGLLVTGTGGGGAW